ncbi:MAG: amidohydrolase family protein, partial [Candidatus Thermoplasmatota archaeon]
MLIVNGNLVADKYIKGGGVYINDGIIEDFGETKVLKKKYRREEYLDAKGKIIMPGMICAHTHFYSAFAIGWLIKEETKNFIEILKKIWWKLDRGLGKEEIILSNAVGCIDAISSGTTTIIDHHSSPNFIKNSLELIAKTTNKFGLRAVLSYEVSDRNGIEKAEEGIKENERAIKNFKGEMTKAIFGIHASFTLSNQTLRKCSEIGK